MKQQTGTQIPSLRPSLYGAMERVVRDGIVIPDELPIWIAREELKRHVNGLYTPFYGEGMDHAAPGPFRVGAA